MNEINTSGWQISESPEIYDGILSVIRELKVMWTIGSQSLGHQIYAHYVGHKMVENGR